MKAELIFGVLMASSIHTSIRTILRGFSTTSQRDNKAVAHWWFGAAWLHLDQVTHVVCLRNPWSRICISMFWAQHTSIRCIITGCNTRMLSFNRTVPPASLPILLTIGWIKRAWSIWKIGHPVARIWILSSTFGIRSSRAWINIPTSHPMSTNCGKDLTLSGISSIKIQWNHTTTAIQKESAR